MNPLDDLPFDLNELRAQPEFNWDCVDGIDQIHKDILKAYERILLSLISPIGKVNENVNGIGNAIVKHAANALPLVAQSLEDVHNNIIQDINNKLNPLTTIYGTQGSIPEYYVVYRQIACNDWIPFIEPWIQPPNDRTHYGPFTDQCGISYAVANSPLIEVGTRNMPAWRQAVMDQLSSVYQAERAASAGHGTVCNPEDVWPKQAGPLDVEVDNANCYGSDGVSVPNPIPTATVYLNGAILDCDGFLSREWVNHGQYPKFLADLGYAMVDGPFYISSDGYLLNSVDYQAKQSLCGPIPTPTPIPSPNCPPCPPPNPDIQGGNNCPAPVVNCPAPVVNIMGSGGSGGGNGVVFDNACCEMIVSSLQQIAIQLGTSPSSLNLPDEDIAIANGLGDDAFNLSRSLIPSIDDFLGRLYANSNESTIEVSVIDVMRDDLLFLRTPHSKNRPLS